MIKPNSRRAAIGFRIVFSGGAALGCAVLLPSCERLSDRMEITEKRELSKQAPPPGPPATSAERFRMQQEAPEAPRENPLTWVVPEGWSEAGEDASPGGMRLINLRFGEGGEGECYLSALPGAAGGMEANINRWRGQMGLPEYSAEELAKLPKKTFLNREATYVNFDGDFKRVGAVEAEKGFRLVGLVQAAPEFTIFVKMTGPKELLARNEGAFDEFVRSISIKR